ncbi:MAG: tRNA (adenosine(37)-N6)-dimethylallyltransferase MiaA [Parcubacteria group bacterium SW_6_46_9]|nr:MAG: tRNA (adenosine(37)-N6)-dimethylallyltransferase MiaA [Parcubacteria group bacterium SW_6_46_9]
MADTQEKLLVICGPTAVGKSSLAVQIAQQYDGEVVSADSRQVYKDLDIATGKITDEEMAGVPHHLLDVVDPQKRFSVHDYKQRADAAVGEIHDRDKLPILCGGSGFYIQSVVDDMVFPDVPPNKKLRNKLRDRSTKSLYKELKAKDPRRAKQIDENNPVRLIRAIEIVDELGEVPTLEKQQRFDTLQIGLDRPDKELKQRIIARTKERLEDGMIKEARELQINRLSLNRMRDLGLEYEHLADFLEDKISKQELFENVVRSDWQYAKKQRTWFQKDDRISWFHPGRESEKLLLTINDFYSD